MKKVLALTAVAALALAGCSGKKEFKISGENLPAELNNSMVYFLEESSPEPFDSVVITDGGFVKTFENPVSDHTIFARLGTGFVRMIPEVGSVRIQKTDDETAPYEVLADNPSGLNAQLQAYTKEIREAVAPIQQEYTETAKVNNDLHMSGTATQEELDSIAQKVNEIGERYMTTSNAISKKYYEANKDNLIGTIAFGEISFDTDDEWISAYEAAGDNVKENKRYKARYETLQKAAETAVGQSYKDYTIEDGLGNSYKLSDYLQDGRYLLVDFWASWCGPCRKAMPHLAEINKTKANTVRVLSIGVWEEKIEDFQKAKDELNMTWETIFDSKSEGVKLYGVEGIPTILLISPEGQILVRTHSPADVDAKLAELNL